LLQTDNHISTPPLSFLQAGCPSCRPTNSVKALKEYVQFMIMLYMISSQSVTDDGISLSVRKSKLAYNSLIFVDISYHITLICLLT